MSLITFTHNQQRGVTLIEVLVAVLVLSIGLLGVASMQFYGLRYNQSAYLRSQAAVVAYDLADRMRANPNGVAAGYYDSIDSASVPSDPACINTGCNNQQLADNDIREWAQYFTANPPMLPGASGKVTKAGGIFTITISWTESTKQGAVLQSLNYKFQL